MTLRFNPRTYIRYDKTNRPSFWSESGFNPRTYIRYDFESNGEALKGVFQSTYLYKVRRYCIWLSASLVCFNPRTYIRYDVKLMPWLLVLLWFQSTYLYKVRPPKGDKRVTSCRFQSTYLYKVRLKSQILSLLRVRFQSTYLYKVRR